MMAPPAKLTETRARLLEREAARAEQHGFPANDTWALAGMLRRRLGQDGLTIRQARAAARREVLSGEVLR